MWQIFRHGIPKSIVLSIAVLGLFFLACVYVGTLLIDTGGSASDWWFGSGFAYGKLAIAAVALSLALLAALPRKQGKRRNANPFYNFPVFSLGLSLITGLTLMLLAQQLFPAFQLERGSFGMALFFAFAGIVVVHLVTRTVSALYSPWRILVLGAGNRACQLQTWVAQNESGNELVAYIDWGNFRVLDPSCNVFADDVSIIDLAVRYNIDEVVVALDMDGSSAAVEVLIDCKMHGISVIDSAEFCQPRRRKNRSALAAVAQAAHLFRWG